MPSVIITGASTGIGRGTAVHFSKHGWQVLLSGRNEKNLKAAVQECIQAGAKDSDVAFVVGDINDRTVAEQLVKTAIDKFGRIDTLVNNAGIINAGKFEDAPIENYDKIFNTNVRSVIQLTKLTIPHIIATKGTIVNVSSVAGLLALPMAGYYAMSKAALDQFTKILCLELAPHGVRVNSVNPAVIPTGIHKTLGFTEEQTAQIVEESRKLHALGRTGTVEEVAKAIFFLAGPDSSFTTGELLKVDGGYVLVRP